MQHPSGNDTNENEPSENDTSAGANDTSGNGTRENNTSENGARQNCTNGSGTSDIVASENTHIKMAQVIVVHVMDNGTNGNGTSYGDTSGLIADGIRYE